MKKWKVTRILLTRAKKMLEKLIEITKDTYKKYKQTIFLKEGNYFIFKATDQFKKILPLIPATNQETGRFSWLLKEEDWIYKLFDYDLEYQLSDEEFENLDIENFKFYKNNYKLHPWQKRFLHELLISLETKKPFRKGLVVGLGGGKTLAVLIASVLGKTIYVAPRHLHGTIKEECKKWYFQISVITTPESAKKYADQDFQVAILDECLSCKNPDALRSKKVTEIFNNIPVIIAMTGTPISAKRALDLRWLRVLGSIVPGLSKNWQWLWGINPRYDQKLAEKIGLPVDEKGKQKAPLIVDGYKTNEITDFLKDVLTVVDISDIMAEIPAKTYERVYLPRPQFFYEILSGLVTEKGRMKRLTQARTCTSGFVYGDDNQVISIAKKPVKLTWCKKFLEDNPEEPIIIFSAWRAELEMLREELASFIPAVVFSGQADELEVQKFTESKTNLLLASAYLAEGMNLQRSRIEVFCSLSSIPKDRVQAEGRIFRFGQKRACVFIDLICKNTLDEKALDLLSEHLEASEEFINSSLEKELEKMSNKRS